MTFGDVLKRLPGWTDSRLRRRMEAKRFPGLKREGKNWRFPREVTLRVIAQMLEEESGVELTPGDRDALACRMLMEGRRDGEVIMELRLSADHVAKLRRSLGLAPAAMELPPLKTPSMKKAAPASSPAAEAAPATPARDTFWDNLAAQSAARRRRA